MTGRKNLSSFQAGSLGDARTRASPGHLAILASAGSGKTTRLTQRYIRLLADKDLKLTPGRICALTFTRKAAGEIFDKIVEFLCDGASSDAAKLSARLGIPGLDEREFSRLLRLFLDHLHRAVIGTMDSFVFGVARAFPVELGIPMAFQAAESDRAEGMAMQQQILADILATSSSSGARDFFEAYKRATFGIEEKKVAAFLDQMIASLHMAYRFCPDRSKWGNTKLIWPAKKNAQPRISDNSELSRLAKIVLQWMEKPGEQGSMNKRFSDSLRNITVALASHDMSAAWHDDFSGAVFTQLMTQQDSLRQGNAVLEYSRREYALPDDVAMALGALMDNLIAVEIERAVEKTNGLFNLLEYYDRAYEKESRESGRFSFSDIQYLLALGDISRNILPISRERKEGRLFIDYRMDSRLDHWLLDEFQDTSDLQWAIFSNLVSELVQGDPEGRERSFFYVGDVKQSVYRWRGGNPGLFLDIQKQYNRAGTVIRSESIAKTYRCSPPVVEAVNRVFSNLPVEHLPERAVEEWKAVWTGHEANDKSATGFTALIQHEETGNPEEARYRLAADLLNEIQPVKRGIGVGILARDNKACGELVNILRRECPGIGFVHEGKFGIIENELARGMLSLVRMAAHPGDEFAWQHVIMSPIAIALKQEGIARNDIAPRLLTAIHDGGFQSFITDWGHRLETICALNEYGRHCLARLETAAARFDATGSRDCNGFLRFIEDYEIGEETDRGSVRIMTIHQAKGLGFDMVILPQLEHRTRMNMTKAEWSDKDILFGGKPFDPSWILKSPKMDIAERDPVLGGTLRRMDEDHCFDALCRLYVAMTRAKHALYMITSPAKEGTAFRPASLLKLQLTGKMEPVAEDVIKIGSHSHNRLYSSSSGDEKWFKSFPVTANPPRAGAESPPMPDISTRKSNRKVLQRSEPSQQETFERKTSDLFKQETWDVLDFGSAIHELFETIEWLDEQFDADTIIKDWRPSKPFGQEVREDVLKQFRRCLASQEVRQAMARPAMARPAMVQQADNVELWREKSFEVILDSKWVSGKFDRVAITRDKAGKPAWALILDYKSDRRLDTEAIIRQTANRHRPQMELYRRALSRILGLPEDRISIELLFTVPGRVFRL